MQTLQKALKLYQLAERLRDDWRLLASLRWYAAHLIRGKWVELAPPRRERSRRLNSAWKDSLKAARRLLGVATREVGDGSGKRYSYYLRADVWTLVQSRLGSTPEGLLRGQESYPYLSEEAASRIEHDREEREFEFELKLLSPALEQQFKRLPVGFKMSPELEELSAELSPYLLERTKAFLAREYNRLGRPALPVHQHMPGPELKPSKPLPSPEELFTRGLREKVKSFMTRVSIDSQF
jgi:hypothetical protein